MKKLVEPALVALFGSMTILLFLLALNGSRYGPGFSALTVTGVVAGYFLCGLVFMFFAEFATVRLLAYERPDAEK